MVHRKYQHGHVGCAEASLGSQRTGSSSGQCIKVLLNPSVTPAILVFLPQQQRSSMVNQECGALHSMVIYSGRSTWGLLIAVKKSDPA